MDIGCVPDHDPSSNFSNEFLTNTTRTKKLMKKRFVATCSIEKTLKFDLEIYFPECRSQSGKGRFLFRIRLSLIQSQIRMTLKTNIIRVFA